MVFGSLEDGKIEIRDNIALGAQVRQDLRVWYLLIIINDFSFPLIYN